MDVDPLDRWCLVRGARVATEPDDRWLDADERTRLDGMRTNADRRRFATAASLLRLTVAAHVGGDPRDVVIDRACADCGRPHGRPRIRGVDPEVHVSVSHAGDIAMVALAEVGPVGVDVELIPADYAEILAVACHPDERDAIHSAHDFAVTWVRKGSTLGGDASSSCDAGL